MDTCLLYTAQRDEFFNDDWDEQEIEDNQPIKEELRQLVKENSSVRNLRERVQNILLAWYYSAQRS